MQKTTKKTTQPSAKQMMAAKKEAKHKHKHKQAFKQITAPQPSNRNAHAIADFKQYLYRKGLKTGEPLDESAQLTKLISLHWRLSDLIYGHPVEAVRMFEHVIRCFKVFACIYNDNELNEAVGKAILSLETAGDHQDLSPNERRGMLSPLSQFLEWVECYNQLIPKLTIQMISKYSEAVHCVLYGAAYFSVGNPIRACLAQIIKGVSIHKLTQATGIKYSTLYPQIIHCAEYLHEAMKCYGNLPYPHTLTDLRDKKADWGKFIENDYNFLKLCIRHNMQVNIIPFEKKTGISLIDYKKFQQDLINIELNDVGT